MKLDERTTGTRRIYNGRIVSLREDDVILPSGVRAKREIVEHRGAVAIIAVTGKGQIVFVRQYRKPAEKVLLEIPAGMIKKGEGAVRAAARELEEETGYAAKKIKKVTDAYTSPGYSTEVIEYCLATGLKKVGQKCEEDENINVELISLKKAALLVKNGKIRDNKTIVGIYIAMNIKGKK